MRGKLSCRRLVLAGKNQSGNHGGRMKSGNLSCRFDFSPQMDTVLCYHSCPLTGREGPDLWPQLDAYSCRGGFSLLLLCCCFDKMRKKSFIRANSHMSSQPPPKTGKTSHLHLLHSGQYWFSVRRFTLCVRCEWDLRNGSRAACRPLLTNIAQTDSHGPCVPVICRWNIELQGWDWGDNAVIPTCNFEIRSIRGNPG